jgi:hypothetical protein
MKFMLIMQCKQGDYEALGAWSPADFKAHIEFMHTLNKELAANGELVVAEGLDMPENAKIVRAKRPDAPVVTDGPFAESKEFLAGFWIVDVATPERAIAIAAKASTAPGKGGVPFEIPIEVRAVGQAPDV